MFNAVARVCEKGLQIFFNGSSRKLQERVFLAAMSSSRSDVVTKCVRSCFRPFFSFALIFPFKSCGELTNQGDPVIPTCYKTG